MTGQPFVTRRRTQRISIRLEPDELLRIEAAARAAHLAARTGRAFSLGAWLRALALDAVEKAVPPVSTPAGSPGPAWTGLQG